MPVKHSFQEVRSKGSRILIVEDEALVAADLEEILIDLGYEVCGIADNHDEAVSIAQSLRPNLILMDIHLAGQKDGVAAATAIRLSVGSPVVFLTAHADDDTLARISVAEPFGYTLKPFDERELKATIEVALCRYEAESRSKKMEKWLSTTLGSMGDGVITTDIDGKINFINLIGEQITGWQRNASLGQELGTIFVLDKNEVGIALYPLLAEAAQKGAVINLEESHFITRHDGSRIPIGDSISVIRDDDGRVTGWVIVFRDLTAVVSAKNEQKKIEEKMKESQRLESLGVLTKGIAHDFNNLLQIILLNVDLGKHLAGASPTENSGAMLGLLGEINHASAHGANLCSQMLAYAGQGRFSLKTTNLSIFVDKAITLLKGSLSKSADLDVQLSTSISLIQADADQLQQIMMNLLINASDALNGKCGTITVKTLQIHADKSFLKQCRLGQDLPEGPYVMLEVSDTGCGMSENTLAHIFDPFFTTKFQGRGLGLAAVSGIVRSHLAALHVKSVPGEGTCLKVLFSPATSVPHKRSETESVARAFSKSFSGRVLVVDDEAAMRLSAKALLKRYGFEVEFATDGQDAIEKLAACSGDYQLVIMDLTMPRLSGHEAFSLMKAQYPHLPVIIMTGYSNLSTEALFTQQSPIAFLQKPFHTDELINIVERIPGLKLG